LNLADCLNIHAWRESIFQQHTPLVCFNNERKKKEQERRLFAFFSLFFFLVVGIDRRLRFSCRLRCALKTTPIVSSSFSTIIFFILDLTSFVFVRFFTQLQLFLEKLQTSTVDEVAEPMKPEAIKFLLVLDHFRIFLH
jgi:hypothetical protein